MNSLLEKINSRYLLVNVVADRAREIAAEAEEMGEAMYEKPVSVAINEVAEGRLTAEMREWHDTADEQ